MFIVKVDRVTLIEILKNNRKGHYDIFLKAQERYRQKFIEILDEKLKNAREGNEIDLHINLHVPTNHTEEYDHVIGMLEMHQDETIQLEEDDYQCYVMDKWFWSKQWSIVNSTYGL